MNRMTYKVTEDARLLEAGLEIANLGSEFSRAGISRIVSRANRCEQAEELLRLALPFLDKMQNDGMDSVVQPGRVAAKLRAFLNNKEK